MLAAVPAPGPEPVLPRANVWVLILLQPAHAFAKIALRQFLTLAKGRGDRDRLVIAFLVFRTFDDRRLVAHRRNVEDAAKAVGIGTATLLRWMKDLGSMLPTERRNEPRMGKRSRGSSRELPRRPRLC